MSDQQLTRSQRPYLEHVRIAREIAFFGFAGMLVATGLLPTATPDAQRVLAVSGLGLLAFTAAWFHLIPGRLLPRHRFIGAVAVVQAVTAYVVWATGGLDSPFFPYYLVPIAASALALRPHGPVITGVVAFLGLFAMIAGGIAAGRLEEIRDLSIARTFALGAVVAVATVSTIALELTRRVLDQRTQTLAEQNLELDTARSITLALSRLHERDELIRAIFAAAQKAIGADRAWLFIAAESEYRHGWTIDKSGVLEQFVSTATLRNPPRLRAVREQRTIVVNDTIGEEGVSRRAREEYGLRSGIFVPLQHRGEVVGVATFSCARPREWAPLEVRLAETIAESSAAAIATYLAFDQLRVERERLAQRTRILEGLANLSDALAISPSDDAAAKSAARSLHQSFGLRGATVLFTDPSLALLEPRASAGDATPHPVVHNPHTCPAIKSGRIFRVESEAAAVQCPYVAVAPSSRGFVCAPLVAAGQTVGAVFLEPSDTSVPEEALVRAASDRVSLHVANQRVLETAQRQAVTDGVTGLYNRHFMHEQLRLLHSLAERHGRIYSLITLDVDQLKRVNDTFGHEAGDLALRALANALKRSLRNEDVAVRTGGDEFLCILPDTPLEGAVIVAERIRAAVEANGKVQPNAAMTVSGGVASWQPGRTVEEMLNAADAALYRAKGAGRDRVASEAEAAGA